MERHRCTRFRGQTELFKGRNPNPEGQPPWGPATPYPYNFTTGQH